MLAGSRWRRVQRVLVLLTTCSLAACQRDKPEKAKVELSNPAELKRKAEQARQALEGLKAPLSALNAKIAALHEQFDRLPPGLPGFGDTRGKFYATSVGLGTLNAKVPWLSSRIDSAVKSGDRAELEQISKDVAHTYDEIGKVDRIALELIHEVLPFNKMAQEKLEELQALGKSSCE